MRRVKGLDKHDNSNKQEGKKKKEKTRKPLQKAEIILAWCLVVECWGSRMSPQEPRTWNKNATAYY